MRKWIDADVVNNALDRIREEAWLHDIPSPTVPEYVEHHDAIQQIMLVIDKERKLLSDAAVDVAPVRRGRWEPFTEVIDGLRYDIKRCSVCGHTKPMRIFEREEYAFNFCPNCGAKMDGGEG